MYLMSSGGGRLMNFLIGGRGAGWGLLTGGAVRVLTIGGEESGMLGTAGVSEGGRSGGSRVGSGGAGTLSSRLSSLCHINVTII